MIHYATLHQVRLYLGAASTETADDTKLTMLIRQSVRSIEKRCRRRFDVRRETRSFDVPSAKIDRLGTYTLEDVVHILNSVGELSALALRLDQDLLDVEEVTNGDDTEVTSAQYVLKPGNMYPKHTIKIRDEAGIYWQRESDGGREQAIDVDAHWGYHPYYDEDAWIDTEDEVEDNPLSSSATSLTVNDIDGDASDLQAVRIQVGNMLRIEDEYLYVQAVNTSTNVATVVRGFHGTTAAAHVLNTQVDVFRPWDDVVLATIRLVAWRYRQKDADAFDRINIVGTGIQISPSAMPPDVLEMLPAPKPGRLL